MAFDYLSIPCMSAEVERVFSQADITLSPIRASMKEDTLIERVSLSHWYRNRLIKDDVIGLIVDEDEVLLEDSEAE